MGGRPFVIEALTPAQDARLLEVKKFWFNVGSATSTDEPRAEAAIRRMYSFIGKDAPTVIWFDSPMTWALGFSALKNSLHPSELGDELNDSLETSLHDSLETSLGTSIRRTLLGSLRFSLGSSLGASLGSSILGAVTNSLRSSLEISLELELETTFGDSLWYMSHMDAYTYGYYDFCAEIGVQYDANAHDKLEACKEYVKAGAGWMIPFDDTVLISRAPIAIRWNTALEPVIHADGEPAVQYADGWSVWALGGVTLENVRYHVHTTHWKAEWLLDEENAEIRRLIIETVGYDAIARDLNAVKRDEWREYALHRIERDVDVEPIQLLSMTCPSTQRQYMIRVPPDVTTARDAATWINHGVDPAAFAAES